ncbi:hypothetical protein [Chitinilyticum litopenaei]|uniref:hypothetical protein n=1 Tax=Chitinilyticum litopenaei TaxID=1121276 RepID=UPI00130DC9E8|nr:hypothetical protein [Chitinilyticum litopenaei]
MLLQFDQVCRQMQKGLATNVGVIDKWGKFNRQRVIVKCRLMIVVNDIQITQTVQGFDAKIASINDKRKLQTIGPRSKCLARIAQHLLAIRQGVMTFGLQPRLVQLPRQTQSLAQQGQGLFGADQYPQRAPPPEQALCFTRHIATVERLLHRSFGHIKRDGTIKRIHLAGSRKKRINVGVI